MKNSVFIRVDPNEELPKTSGNYLATLQNPANGTLVVKKAFFCSKEFKLKNGRKNWKVVNWFKRVEVETYIYSLILIQDLKSKFKNVAEEFKNHINNNFNETKRT